MMPFIGNAGLWIFVIIGFVISFLILFEDMNFNIDIKKITPSFKKVDTSAKPKRITSRTTEKREKKQASAPVEERVSIKEEDDIPQIVIEDNEEGIADIRVDDLNIISLDQTEEFTNKAVLNIEEEISDISIVEESASHGIIVDELEENKKLLEDIELGKTEKPKDFELPPTKFFQSPPKDKKSKISEAVIDKKIEDLLENYLCLKLKVML